MLMVTVTGRIDTDTAPQLEAAIKEKLEQSNKPESISFDFASVEYVSSAGLRVILNTSKKLDKEKGKVTVKNANESVREVFAITGFDKFLSVK